MNEFDVVVIGAGPAGSAAAIGLARAGLTVAIVERDEFPRGKVCGEFVSGPTWELLEALGAAAALHPHAGPAVRTVGFYGGETIVTAPMPGGAQAGRAIGRHRLDTVLLERAIAAGACAFQPATVEAVTPRSGAQEVHLRGADGTCILRARQIVDAHGSWLRGPYEPLPPASARDLIGFKARFSRAALPKGLMPLVVFPGGYGGLVETESGLVSFSCCMTHEALRSIRSRARTSGEAVFAHVAGHCRGFREVMDGARLEGAWRGAGPIHPGVRCLSRPGTLAVGNAAGEAHPLVAEGISMALQSGWLAAQHLASAGADGTRDYARDWRRHFLPRLRAAEAFARLADRSAPLMGGAVRAFPWLLTAGARFSGKSRPVPMGRT
jgi:flavin-dependent dehydrogenase